VTLEKGLPPRKSEVKGIQAGLGHLYGGLPRTTHNILWITKDCSRQGNTQ
jgi:hypothetical protein